MINKWKIAAAAALIAAGMASPAFAQAFDPTYGTGNPMAAFYDHNGALHLGNPLAVVPQQNRIATHQNGLNAFAMVPNVGSSSSFSPGANGGGSFGYNANLKTDQW